jgi:hypothetical protein
MTVDFTKGSTAKAYPAGAPKQRMRYFRREYINSPDRPFSRSSCTPLANANSHSREGAAWTEVGGNSNPRRRDAAAHSENLGSQAQRVHGTAFGSQHNRPRLLVRNQNTAWASLHCCSRHTHLKLGSRTLLGSWPRLSKRVTGSQKHKTWRRFSLRQDPQQETCSSPPRWSAAGLKPLRASALASGR